MRISQQGKVEITDGVDPPGLGPLRVIFKDLSGPAGGGGVTTEFGVGVGKEEAILHVGLIAGDFREGPASENSEQRQQNKADGKPLPLSVQVAEPTDRINGEEDKNGDERKPETGAGIEEDQRGGIGSGQQQQKDRESGMGTDQLKKPEGGEKEEHAPAKGIEFQKR